MAIDFSTSSPLAQQLQSVVQPKLAEFGWTTGGDDTTLFEYILLMLHNDKNEAQVASELSNDLLDLGPENNETRVFAQWLFETIEGFKAGEGAAREEETAAEKEDPEGDMDVDVEGGEGTIPTGPKAMRTGSGAQAARPARGGGRMLNQLNKSMNRNDQDSALHRVRGGGGVGRINSHSRDVPKGPRGQNIGRGIEAMANGRGMGNANMNMGNMNGMNMGGGMPGMPPMGGQNNMPGMLNPQQQMALMAMYEQQAQMMQQIFSGGGAGPTPFVNPNFNQNRNGQKKSLQQRMDRPLQGGRGMNPNAKSFAAKKDANQDSSMTDSAAETGDGMDVEPSNTRPEPSSTICKFNLRCTNPTCAFLHQSAAAPPGTPIDPTTSCSFGAACKNKKCAGTHPSPAARQAFQADQDCAFWPNCRDQASCPYKHPTTRPCKNGADCSVEGCAFAHSQVLCRFKPCLNARCAFKHVEGQKGGVGSGAGANVWVKKDEHVSERKFVDEEGGEEVILPNKTPGEGVDVAL